MKQHKSHKEKDFRLIAVVTYDIILIIIASLCAYFISPWCFCLLFLGANYYET